MKTIKKGNAIITIYDDFNNINDSLLLESCTKIAKYENDEENIYFTIEVCGDVYVKYFDEVYKDVSKFPAELIELIKNRKVYFNENVEVIDNNWFNVVEWEKYNGELMYVEDTPDETLDVLTDENIIKTLENFADWKRGY